MSLSEKEAQELHRLAEALERISRELHSLAGGKAASLRKEAPRSLPDDFVARLKGMQRNEAAQLLASLSHPQLGRAFVVLGGTTRDMKRSKDWLVERILWNLFDFQAGHQLIKGSGS